VESATLQEGWMNQESLFKTLGSSIFLFAMSKNAKVAPAPATGAKILPSFQRLLDAAKSGRVSKAKDAKKGQDAVFILENNKLFPPGWIRLIIPLSTISSRQFGDQETSIFSHFYFMLSRFLLVIVCSTSLSFFLK
jgi:hypothetical protein